MCASRRTSTTTSRTSNVLFPDCGSFCSSGSRGARRRHFAPDTVLDPMAVPPFDGVHLGAVHLHGEMQVIASGKAGVAAAPHLLPLFHRVADLHTDVAQVT